MSLFYLLFCLTLSVLNTFLEGGNKYQENHQANYRLTWYVERAMFSRQNNVLRFWISFLSTQKHIIIFGSCSAEPEINLNGLLCLTADSA